MLKKLTASGEWTFLETHPWINFRLDLKHASHRLWMLLGEASSKCEHLAGVPLRPDTAARLSEIYLAKGVHATTNIEGNTLSEEQVRQQIKRELTVPPSQQYLQQETQNIIDACGEIVENLWRESSSDITLEDIKHFNEMVLRDLPEAEGVVPGEFRHHSVGVLTYRGAPWKECEPLTRCLADWLNGPDFNTDDPQMRFPLLILKAVVAHLYLAWIHPFGDGNGRTARLLEFQILARSGLVSLPAAHLLSNHYNKTRTRYYAELDRSSKTEDGPVKFFEYACEGFVDGLREQLRTIREQQLDVTWVNYVHDQFRDETPTKTVERRKYLLLDMPKEYIAKRDITSVSSRVARAYAGKSEKSLTRDINFLLSASLLEEKDNKYRPNRNIILAFLPP